MTQPLQRLANNYRLTRNASERGKLYLQIRTLYPDAPIEARMPIMFDVDQFLEYPNPSEIVAFVSDEDRNVAWFSEIGNDHRLALIPYLDREVLLDRDVRNQLSVAAMGEIIRRNIGTFTTRDRQLLQPYMRDLFVELSPRMNRALVRSFAPYILPSTYRRLSPEVKKEILNSKSDKVDFLRTVYRDIAPVDRESVLMNIDDIDKEAMGKILRQELALFYDEPSLLYGTDMDANLMKEAIIRMKPRVRDYIYRIVYPGIEGRVPDRLRRAAHIYSGFPIEEDFLTQYNQYKYCQEKYRLVQRSIERYSNLTTPGGVSVANIPPEFFIEVDDGLVYGLDATENFGNVNPFTGTPLPQEALDIIAAIRIQNPHCVYREELDERRIDIPERMLLDWYPGSARVIVSAPAIAALTRTDLSQVQDLDSAYLILAAFLYANPALVPELRQLIVA